MTEANRVLFHAPENAEWMIQSNRYLDSLPEKRFIYLNHDQKIIAVMLRDNDGYDPDGEIGLF